ncbi:MAG: hypothetical protein WBL61_23185 [Bryobacteraceae bacterium]
MGNRTVRCSVLVAALAGLALSAAWAETPTTELQITVKTQGGHAIDRAEVIVRWKADAKHPAERFNKAVNTTFEMRTNQDGIAKVPAIPQGSILIQVNAKGYQTYGHVFDIYEDEKTIDVVLNQPQQQYSAH